MIEELLDHLSDAVPDALAHFRVPGLALAVADRSDVRSRHFGVAHQERRSLVDDETIFQIGSISKIVTGTAVMRLVDRGVLDLDLPVRHWLPDLKLADTEARQQVTLRHLLLHTGGWNGDYGVETGRGDDALDRVRPTLATARQLTPVGSTYHYNNLGFVLTGLVIQAATGESFEQVVRELVIDPLGMTRSRYFAEDVIFERIAAGHIVNGKETVVSPYGRPRSRAPNGGVLSCVSDLVRFGRFHLANGRLAGGESLIDDRLIVSMREPQVSSGIDDVDRGVAWVVSRRYGVDIVSHGGATPGFQTGFWVLPSHGLIVVALTNASTGGGVVRVVERGIQRFLKRGALPVASTSVDANRFGSIEGVYSSVASFGVLAIGGSADAPFLHTFLGGVGDPVVYPFAASDTSGRFEIESGRSEGTQFDFVADGRYLRFNGSRLFERVTTKEQIAALQPVAERYPTLAPMLGRSRTTAL